MLDYTDLLRDMLTNVPVPQNDIKKLFKEKFGISLTTRTIRVLMKAHNGGFNKGLYDYMIIDLGKGTYKTRDVDDIHKYNKAKVHHALSKLKSAYDSEKRLGLNKNISFDEYCSNWLKKGE